MRNVILITTLLLTTLIATGYGEELIEIDRYHFKNENFTNTEEHVIASILIFTVVDIAQTIMMQSEKEQYQIFDDAKPYVLLFEKKHKYTELNPLLGKYPSNFKIATYLLAGSLLQIAAYKMLSNDFVKDCYTNALLINSAKNLHLNTLVWENRQIKRKEFEFLIQIPFDL